LTGETVVISSAPHPQNGETAIQIEIPRIPSVLIALPIGLRILGCHFSHLDHRYFSTFLIGSCDGQTVYRPIGNK
jgi:hypothetical protein